MNSRFRSSQALIVVLALCLAVLHAQAPQPPGTPVVIAPGVWAVTPATVNLVAGQTQQLTSTSGSGTTWLTENATIATVSPSGLVTAISPGTVLITARKNNMNGQARVTVTSAPPPVDCVVSAWSEWGACVNGQQTRTRTILVPPSNGGAACGPLSETQACSEPPPPTPGEAIVTLTTQEALYDGGTAGIARTNEPLTVGVPLPDNTLGVDSVSELGVSGATVAQFQELAAWPSGRVKWALVNTQLPTLNAGATSTALVLVRGTGTTAGTLATDNGSTITVATGTATFTIKKANFNGLDTVVVGSTTIVATGTSQGLVVTGPVPGLTTCGGCTTIYSSANDSLSTAMIEENGPARAIVKATGMHRDSGGNGYMRFTVRMHFYKNKSYVKAVSSLQNADLGASNSFASAYKGHQGYEWRLSPNLTGTLNYTMANETATPLTGTISGSDDLYLYQAETTFMKWQDWCGFGCVPYSTDQGFRVNLNGSDIDTGTASQPVGGWADLRNASGAGVQIGVYQMAAYWPKSLEFLDGGSDVRIGIWARQNSQPYYAAWPQHAIHTLFFNFHDAALSSPANDFLKLQHYLVARAPYTWYNSTGVFPWTLVDPTTETDYYEATRAAATPAIADGRDGPYLDYGVTNPSWPLSIYRFYAWGAGGGANQTEFRWSRLLNFIARGMTGRYLDSSHFYRFLAEQGEPRSDGFSWAEQVGGMDGFNRPARTSSSDSLTFRNWRDQEHGHWYGMPDYYNMTGDLEARDAILDGFLDWFRSPVATYQQGTIGGRSWTVNTTGNTVNKTAGADFTAADFYPGKSVVINGTVYFVLTRPSLTQLTVSPSPGTSSSQTMYSEGGLFNTRAAGVNLMGAARLYTFLLGIGDTANAAIVASQGDRMYQSMVLGANCANGRPPNCAITTVDGSVFRTGGQQPDRGFHWGSSGTSGTWCQAVHSYRVNSTFQTAVLIAGLMEYSTARGTTWSEYTRARDVAYGLSQFANSELAVFTTPEWDDNGYRFGLAFDVANNCPGESPEENFQPTNNQTIWSIFAIDHEVTGAVTSWTSRMAIALQRLMAAIGATTSDYGSYYINDVIARMSESAPLLTTRPLTAFTANGGGSYTLQWAAVSGGGYRIKWSTRAIVDWIGFDPGNNVYTGTPTTTANWFAATSLTTTPSCNSASCVVTVDTGTAGLTAANFSVKSTATGSAISSVTWTNMPHTSGWPGYNGFLQDVYDPVSGQIQHYGIIAASSSIYSTNQFAYNVGTNLWTNIGGNNTLTSTCPATWPTWPPDRHPDGQMAVDPFRNRLWMVGGVCGGNNQQDMAYMGLNPTPASNTWTRVTPAHFPTVLNSGALVYDSVTDLLILFGPNSGSIFEVWVYAPSASLSAAQIAAGATTAQDWIEVTYVGGPFPGDAYPRVVYSASLRQSVLFGGLDNASPTNELWFYTTSSKTLTKRCTSPCSPPPVYTGPSSPPTYAFVEIPSAGVFFYHQTHNTGAPRDWTFTVGADPAADDWAVLSSGGSGPTTDSIAAYDTVRGVVYLWTRNAGSGQPDVWLGQLNP